jgi:transposase
VLFIPRSTKIYMGRSPVNMSKSFNGLTNEVREVLRKDPLSGHIFLFFNRRRTMVKLRALRRIEPGSVRLSR